MFPKMLAQNCMDFSTENTMYNKDADKEGTARYSLNLSSKIRIIFSRRLLSTMIKSENTNVYSLEVSMYGYKPDPKSDKIVPYTEENCRSFLQLISKLNNIARYSARPKHLSSSLGLLQNIWQLDGRK